jgi:CheY-like chemotaxis protein
MNKKALILVVDDNADCRKLLVWLLERQGFYTISAKTGHDAVALAIRCQPHLVLMDLNMPGLNGYEATRAIHADGRGRQIPVIAVSADCAEYGFEHWARKAGFTAFVAKPWEQDELLELVTRVLTDVVQRPHAA